jgi:hypothetical protein
MGEMSVSERIDEASVGRPRIAYTKIDMMD